MLEEFRVLVEEKLEKFLEVENVSIDTVDGTITIDAYTIRYVDGKAKDTITVRGIGNPKTLAKVRGNAFLRSSLELLDLVSEEHEDLDVLDYIIANDMVGTGLYEDYCVSFNGVHTSVMLGAGYRIRARVIITNLRKVIPNNELVNEVMGMLDVMFENDHFFNQEKRLEFKATMVMALDAEGIDPTDIMASIRENLSI